MGVVDDGGAMAVTTVVGEYGYVQRVVRPKDIFTISTCDTIAGDGFDASVDGVG